VWKKCPKPDTEDKEQVIRKASTKRGTVKCAAGEEICMHRVCCDWTSESDA